MENQVMRVITGLFDTHEQAASAAEALREAGVTDDDISIVGPDGRDESSVAENVGIGTAVGGAGGLLAGLASFAIPGIGPVVGVGWLAATLIGAAAGGVAGGILGGLTSAGVDEDDAHVYAEGIRRGGTLVTARVDETQADAAQAILSRSGSADLAARRADYQSSGWSRFDETAERDPLEAYEDREADDPIVAPFPR
jgi:hypothetical protein